MEVTYGLDCRARAGRVCEDRWRRCLMNYVDQEIVVQGAEDESPGVGVAFGGKLFRQIERTVQPCVRMALTGRSAQVGQPPKWLQAAWDVRATGFSRRGSDMVIHLSVPKLGDAAPKVFEQQRLWDEAVKPDETALELMESSSRTFASKPSIAMLMMRRC